MNILPIKKRCKKCSIKWLVNLKEEDKKYFVFLDANVYKIRN